MVVGDGDVALAEGRENGEAEVPPIPPNPPAMPLGCDRSNGGLEAGNWPLMLAPPPKGDADEGPKENVGAF